MTARRATSRPSDPITPEWALTKLTRHERPRIASGDVPIVDHHPLADRYMALTLHAPHIAGSALPGQFVMLTAARRGQKVPALPRPMAIYAIDRDLGAVEVLYGVIGDGTHTLRGFAPGETMHVVGPLGQPFDIPADTGSVLLIGRGIGTCSLTTVAQHNHAHEVETIAVTSAREPGALIGADLYRRHDAHAVYEVTDAEGSSSPEALFATLTTDLDPHPPQLILTCGSTRLIALSEALAQRWGARVQVSVEAHMACGIGYCHGCASGARSAGEESPLICDDGPVFAWEPVAVEAL